MQTQRTTDEFKNEPFTDYSKPENADAMRQAIEQVRGELGRDYPVIINGEKIKLEKKFESFNPAEKSQVVGRFSDADADSENLVNRAIDAATEAFKTWRNVRAEERANIFSAPRKLSRAQTLLFGVDGFRGRQNLGGS
jgi:1-pyrroline-5-carboxylate dehydrogenase